ncbi:MAG: tRNA dihydrouridine synthase DusB, partial [Gammaproteobacteria bacterium]|nr:tRNA dihydrouridine synthase DusB [Gammaproteobacteria bacterium]
AASEMVAANALLWGSRKTRQRVDHSGEPQPRIVQIAGADPRMMREAALLNVDHGAEIIDINMGCPAKKVCRQLAGSALLRDEDLVARILSAVVAAVPVPVTLKIRTGWDRDNRNGVQIARLAEQCGVAALAVHGRTRADAFRGAAEYATIAEIKQAVNIPVIANGDIRTPEQARAVLEQTQADGLMIGRAAQGNPWIFRQVLHFLECGRELPAPDAATVCETLCEHLHNLYHFYGSYRGVRIARKHIAWYCKERHGAAAFRAGVNQAEHPDEQLRMVREFLLSAPQHERLAA